MSQLLSSPQPVRVATDCYGKPTALLWHGRRDPVTVCNHWRMEGDWWRQRIAREYYRLLTKSGTVCTVYHDVDEGGWYLQKMLD